MKDLIIPCNNEAHSRALVATVGEETAQVVLKAYKAIDSAMVFGYERGLKDAVAVATIEPEAHLNANVEGADIETFKTYKAMNAVEALEKEAFSNGYDIGKHEGLIKGFEDGHKASTKEASKALKACEALLKLMFSQGRAEGYTEGWNAADKSGHGQSAWDHGYDAGFADAEVFSECSYDDGYVAGVSDARLCPSEADREVERLCGCDEAEEGSEYDFEDFDEYDHRDDFDWGNVSDSADETDAPYTGANAY
jgi:hypothetical protein